MKTRPCDRHYGLGPLYELPPGGPTGDPAPGAPPASPPALPAGGGAPPTPPEQTVPYARFAEVNEGYQKLLKAEEERKTKELADKGEHAKVAEREKARADSAEEAKVKIGRKAAFVAAASGKVSDVSAAYKLAVADGLLLPLELDDEGEPKDDKVLGGVIDKLTKTYEFLKPGTKNFGAPAGGNGPSDGSPEPKTSRDMLRQGYADLARRS